MLLCVLSVNSSSPSRNCYRVVLVQICLWRSQTLVELLGQRLCMVHVQQRLAGADRSRALSPLALVLPLPLCPSRPLRTLNRPSISRCIYKAVHSPPETVHSPPEAVHSPPETVRPPPYSSLHLVDVQQCRLLLSKYVHPHPPSWVCSLASRGARRTGECVSKRAKGDRGVCWGRGMLPGRGCTFLYKA